MTEKNLKDLIEALRFKIQTLSDEEYDKHLFSDKIQDYIKVEKDDLDDFALTLEDIYSDYITLICEKKMRERRVKGRDVE